MAAPYQSVAGSIDNAVAVPTLIGSIMSASGAGFIILSYLFLPLERNHFRHTLILNLAMADLIMGINNSASGIVIVSRQQYLTAGPLCKLNAFTGQLTTQCVDFSILLISSCVLYVVTQGHALHSQPSATLNLLLIISPWILPIITATTALAKDYFQPVSGNWCWVQPQPVYLRYLLMHGWRILIIITVSLMAICIRRYSKQQAANSKIETDPETSSEIRKVLLLNGYARYYIILWIPGLANRLAEAVGKSIRWLSILQACTQFVGFANAMTFGWSEIKEAFGMQKLLEMLLGFMLGD